jgi:hypothetical protein
MGYTMALVLCDHLDRFDTTDDLAQIREIEKATGFEYNGKPVRTGHEIGHLTR